MPAPTVEQVIPSLRQDLQLFPGPREADGAPTYQLYDSATGNYFKFSWAEAQIIKRLKPGITYAKLQELVTNETTLEVSELELHEFFRHTASLGLIELKTSGAQIQEDSKRKRIGIIKNVLLHYLFFRIPLWNPDDFLEATLHRVKPLVSRGAMILYFVSIVLGLVCVGVWWEEFISTFTYFFSWTGLLAYGVAIMATKIIHEMAHAYTAKSYGLRVPTMGVAFLVLFPVLYTDATESWRLADRRKRMMISGAGIIVELTIAGMATLFWVMSGPGIFQSIWFVLASANWISTLLINLNPALKFDGYYLLSDLLQIDNLQTRAFHVARCAGYRVLLGLKVVDPEPKLGSGKRRLLIVYSVYTWIYRVFLYTAIALLVYYKFTKVLGTFLFFVEILVFFVWPVYSEAQTLSKFSGSVTWNTRSKITGSLLVVLLMWFVLPLPHPLRFPATTLPKNGYAIYVPYPGQITELPAERGKRVQKGEMLALITSDILNARLDDLKAQREILKAKINIISERDELRQYYLERQAELSQTEAEVSGIEEQITQLTVRAEMDGYLYDWNELLKEGQWISEDAILGHLAESGPKEVIAFVPERDISKLSVGDVAYFSPLEEVREFAGVVEQIGPIRLQKLQYPELASVYGGALPVAAKGEDDLVFLDSYYPVIVRLNNVEDLPIGREGKLIVRGRWTSKFMRLMGRVASVLLRESDL